MPEPNFQNRTLLHGDNMPFLRGMNPETIDLIAIDSPFNKNKDVHVHSQIRTAFDLSKNAVLIGRRLGLHLSLSVSFIPPLTLPICLIVRSSFDRFSEITLTISSPPGARKRSTPPSLQSP